MIEFQSVFTGKRFISLMFLWLCFQPALFAQDEKLPEIKVPRNHFVAQFRDIEIRDFLKTMAQITKRNILIDDAVKGKITIVSYRPIHVNRAMAFMKQVLQVKGYAVIEEPNLIKVVRAADAQSTAIPEDGDPDNTSTGMLTKLVKLPPFISINEVSSMLKGILGKNTNVTTYKPSNAIVMTGYAQSIRRGLSILEDLLASMEGDEDVISGSSGVHIYRVKNMPVEGLAQVLVRLDNPEAAAAAATTTKGKKAPTRAKPAGKIKAVAHKESNSIIVTATPEEWSEIRYIIENLDQIRKQILLEVLITEVSSGNTNDFGIDWRYQGTDAAHTQFNTGLALEGGLVSDSGQISGNNTLSGFSLGFLEKGGDLLGIFNANMSRQNFNVLSAPQVMTLDNQEAEINVGQDVPVRTQARTSGGGDSQVSTESFEYRPSGIKLKFTPHINSEGRIGLDLFSEVTTIEGGDSSISNPKFNKRNVKTSVTVEDRQTIVIGGLVSTQKTQAVSKVPFLGDIPFVGFLFRRTTYKTVKTNMMVFITPHILTDRNDSDRMTIYKRSGHERESRIRANELKLWPEEEIVEDREKQLEAIEEN